MTTIRFKQLLTSIVFLLLLQSLNSWAEESTKDLEKSPEPAAVPESLKSPRATMTTFIRSMNDIKRGQPERIQDAVSSLDLDAVNKLVREEQGRTLAWTLLEILDRTRVIQLDRVPARTKGKPYTFHTYSNGKVRISRLKDGRWLFDQETIAKLPAILDGLGEKKKVKGVAQGNKYLPWHIRLRQSLPQGFKEKSFLLENWHWIGLFLIILVGVAIDRQVSWLLRHTVRRWRKRTEHKEFVAVSDQILRPLGLMAMAIVWWVGLNLLGLPESAMVILLVAVKFLASISGVWAAYRLVDLISVYLERHARASRSKLDDALVPLIPKTLKIFITVIGFLFIADNLNLNITSLLAGLGLGGLAFALAAKDMVQNLFGSVTVLMDRTFSVGDWVVVGDIEGTVEQIGFRSTRIRTFYNSVMTVPNSKFITADVDNMGERRFRRLKTMISLTYNTPPDKIESFCEGARELVRQHPYMRKDYYHVYFNGMSASSLDILVYVFWQTPDWSTELRERHRFLLDLLRLAQRLGVEYAFPTQTLYMKSEPEGENIPIPETEQEAALTQGRELARAIVAETTGMNTKPPPVVFPSVS